MTTVRDLMEIFYTMTTDHPDAYDLEVFIIIEDGNAKFVLEPSVITGLSNVKDHPPSMIGIHLAHSFTDLCIMQAEGKTRN